VADAIAEGKEGKKGEGGGKKRTRTESSRDSPTPSFFFGPRTAGLTARGGGGGKRKKERKLCRKRKRVSPGRLVYSLLTWEKGKRKKYTERGRG